MGSLILEHSCKENDKKYHYKNRSTLLKMKKEYYEKTKSITLARTKAYIRGHIERKRVIGSRVEYILKIILFQITQARKEQSQEDEAFSRLYV